MVFVSQATNLVSGDTSTRQDVFVRDRQLGTTERVSVGAGGVEASAFSQEPSISNDGNIVQFSSSATNLVSDDTNGQSDIFVPCTIA